MGVVDNYSYKLLNSIFKLFQNKFCSQSNIFFLEKIIVKNVIANTKNRLNVVKISINVRYESWGIALSNTKLNAIIEINEPAWIVIFDSSSFFGSKMDRKANNVIIPMGIIYLKTNEIYSLSIWIT